MDAESYRRDIIQFVNENRTVPQLKFVLDDLDGVRIEPITSDGMINYIYRVQSAKGEESIIIKYGEDTVRLKFGSGDGVTLKRQKVEYEALKLIHDLLPNAVPQPYCFDTKHQIIAMEDLGHMHLLHDDLVQGKMDPDLASKLGCMFAKLHSSTHRDNVTEARWQTLRETFSDKDIKGLIVSYRLIRAFKEEDPFNDIPPECLSTYRDCRSEIESSDVLPTLIDLYNMEQCVVHVDTHSKSIFASKSRVAIFDCEWATLGHPVIDVAFNLTWYIFALLELLDQPGIDKRKIIAETDRAIGQLLDGYFTESKNLCSDTEAKGLFLSQVSAFVGAYLFGHANFANIENYAKQTPARRIEAMEMGTRLMTNFSTIPVKTMESFSRVMFSKFR